MFRKMTFRNSSNSIKKAAVKLFALMTAILLCLMFAACGESENTVEETDESSSDTAYESGTENISQSGSTSESDTDKQSPETTGNDKSPDKTADETTAPAESEATEQNTVETLFRDPLTGLPIAEELVNQRPVAIMINNYKRALPQLGIRYADVMYECLAEGGITRLVMLVTDYEELPVIGSVRSSRDYYIDFAQNHNAIYVHAGGSSYAYEAIKSRSIDNLDGVNMYLPTTFYRDSARISANGYEHSLMTTGQGIVEGIAYKHYETEQPEGFEGSFSFVEYGSENALNDGMDAKHVIITYTASQFPQYIYNPKTNTYLRYQFAGDAHVDGETGDQLEFTNLIILVCKHTSLNDDAGRIAVETTGSGSGYYIYGGKYIQINWEKADHATPMKLTDSLGNELKLNCGKTMINIISPEAERSLVLNHQS